MERADFVHLVRLSENASAQDSAAYRRSVAAFAALGYAWVVGCLLLAGGILWWMAAAALQGRFRAAFVWGLVGAVGLLWTSARALWCRFEPPQGLRISREQAPALFEALERIRKKVKGPPVHDVYLDEDFNASISQRPRWGLFGGSRNTLTVGLPLLMALDRQRLLAVLAHEYGHLRGDHGRFAAWIYRTRLSWARLHESLGDDESPVSAATQGFLRWYFPRFVAKTFALARQDEYEADRIAGRLLGKEAAAAALLEIAVKSDWLDQAFWPSHWSVAAENALPQGPFQAMRKLLPLAPPEDFARQSLRQAMRRISDVDDTHPVLRDRLEALDADAVLPDWSQRPALELLGGAAAQWIAHFDKRWCADNASEWKLQHARLARVRGRVGALAASKRPCSADELVELADLEQRLDPKAPVIARYEQALALTPHHGGALRGLAQCLPGNEAARRLGCLSELHEHHPAQRWWAARAAVEQLEADPAFDQQVLKLWRERLRQAEDAEQRAWQELSGTPFFQAISRHDLSEFELTEWRQELCRCEPVVRAWLVRKNLREFASRRCYLMFVEVPGMSDPDRWELCRALEHSVPLPGQVLVLWAGKSPALPDIERQCGPASFSRSAS